ncbi:hypothetical protein [Streptomyces chromofuscus]|uniref:Uncharacterized protein n=1 Tax=Streptomyces chromofuscus TaxID=42881 RepID=A0A7M2T2V3_STRCW|nr:hypothetical protein [Streptomyces chromofuscus]QOV43017.1 hypothetical protein IPT68_24995 [Streptomyces chromofuscus]GGS93033.1 hypothetical protein GCM10010254_11200 [Streptomyces chromofuscus]
MPPPELDFRLDDFEAADERAEEAFWHAIGIEQDMLTALAEYHTPDGSQSFYVLHNGAATWGIPGEPQLVALYLQRDLAGRTFRFEHAKLPLSAMAQSWLIHRGCPRDAIGLLPGMGTPSADETTRALEQRLMGDGDHFALLCSYTRDDPDDMTTVVVLRALDERSPAPFRVLHEEVDTDAGMHTLREGGFATVDEAVQWCDNRLGGEAAPLPPVRLTPRRTRPSGTVPAAPAQRPPGRSR